MGLEAGSIIRHYQLLGKLGEGGMGVVWKARDLKLDRDVALKFLPEAALSDPEMMIFFEREAKAVAALRHPNIVTIYSIEDTGDSVFYTMEYVDGATLSDSIRPGGLPLEHFLNLALPLAEAVAAAHARGIIHRDLKPGNIMIEEDGTLKILDFGLARFVGPEPALPAGGQLRTETLDSAFLGTLCYMSPEQLKGKALDHRTDIFSLGIVLYEMASGQLPFTGETASEIIASILRDEPTPITDIKSGFPPRLEHLIHGCLEKETSDRLNSAKRIVEELNMAREEKDDLNEPGPLSIAVLAFNDISREKDQAYFCDGVAEDIIAALSKFPALHVTPRSASFMFKETRAGHSAIAAELGVTYILDGSVRRSAERLRITVQLLDARRGFTVWSDSYLRQAEEIFTVQAEIAADVARALKLTLPAHGRKRPGKPKTGRIQAYDYYLRGRSFYFQYDRNDMEFALQLFSRATEIDKDYALAYSGQADCWSFIYLYSERRESIRLEAEAAARRAMEIAPDSAQALASYAVSVSLAGRNAEAEEYFTRATEIDPGLFEAWYFHARNAFAGGDLAKAVLLYEKAMEVKPDDFQSPLLVAQIYDDIGQPETARECRRRGVMLVERRLDLHPGDTRALYMGANGLVAMGETEKGLEFARRAQKIAPDEPMVLYNLGCIFSLAGEKEAALDCLEKAASGGQTQKGWYEHDSNLDPIRDHPRFQALLRRLG